MNPPIERDYTTQVYAKLRHALTLLSEYSAATGRLGMHDLALLDTLDGNAEALADSPEKTLVALAEVGDAVFIGGPKGYVWEQFDDDAASVLREHRLLRRWPHVEKTGCGLSRDDFAGEDDEPCEDGGRPWEHPPTGFGS